MEIIEDVHEVVGANKEKSVCQVSPNGNILQNYNIISQPRH